MKSKKKSRLVLEIIKLIIAVITMITAIYSAGSFLKINNQTQQGLINAGDESTINYSVSISDYFAETKTEAEEIIVAQDNFFSQDYHEAYKIYAKYCKTNAIACINLGYLYSKGLGVECDRKLAMQYYLQAYEVFNMSEGLSNYSALNFVMPSDIDGVLDAIQYIYKTGNSDSMKFIASLETKYLNLDSENTEKNASKFMSRTSEEKKNRIMSLLKPYNSDSVVVNPSEDTTKSSDKVILIRNVAATVYNDNTSTEEELQNAIIGLQMAIDDRDLSEIATHFRIGVRYKRGDADGDGEITILDATYTQRSEVGITLPTPIIEIAADVDSDGYVSIIDATLVQRYLVGIPTVYNIGEFID